MNKTTIATIFAIAVLAIGGYVYLQEPFNPDRAIIQKMSNKFMEDIQFKDFGSSARYHHELEQDRVDIGRSIEELFLLKPEMLDILDYRIARTEIDSTGRRGRVLVNTRFRPLNRDEEDDIEEADLQIYWMLRHPDCPLGTDCEDQVCTNDAGQPAMREVEPEEVDDDEEPGPTSVPYQCDPSLEHQWFMNLDSTLEQRDYR
jgi:hypothetical protein